MSIWLWVSESKILLQTQGYIRHIADNASTVVYTPHSASCEAGLWLVLNGDNIYLPYILPLVFLSLTVLFVSSPPKCVFPLSPSLTEYLASAHFFKSAILPFSLPLIQGHSGLNKTMTKPLLSTTAQTLWHFTMTVWHRDRIRNRPASPTHIMHKWNHKLNTTYQVRSSTRL